MEPSTVYILTLNGGSSSLKFSLFNLVSNEIEWIGAVNTTDTRVLKIRDRDELEHIFTTQATNQEEFDSAGRAVLEWLKRNKEQFVISAIGYRLVQGGPHHHQPELLTEQVLNSLEKFTYLAPNHLPDEIRLIKLFQQAYPEIDHVACFDTAFHRDMPPHSKFYALPPQYRDKGIIRYGFHGLSYEFVMHSLTENEPDILKKKIIIAHLGSGASMVAIQNGRSVDTTMGLTPIGGLVMSTRSGDLDPGVLLYLLKEEKMSAGVLDDLLSKNAGLKAIAGTGDVRELTENQSEYPQAAFALDLFCYQARKFIGALAAAMGGLDLLVFTGGIGENSDAVRGQICKELEFMGIAIDDKANTDGNEHISNTSNKVAVMVIKTNEEWIIAKHTLHTIKNQNLTYEHIN